MTLEEQREAAHVAGLQVGAYVKFRSGRKIWVVKSWHKLGGEGTTLWISIRSLVSGQERMVRWTDLELP